MQNIIQLENLLVIFIHKTNKLFTIRMSFVIKIVERLNYDIWEENICYDNKSIIHINIQPKETLN